MIDDKEIDIAARAVVLSKHINETAYFQLRSIEDFKDGAKWAINEVFKDLWHHASEKPNKFNHYGFAALYVLQDNHQIRMVLYDKDNMSWKNVISINEYWLYVDDLLPNEGGEQ